MKPFISLLKSRTAYISALILLVINGSGAALSYSLREMAGEMIMIGFHGTEVTGEWADAISEQIREGLIGGLILYNYNIGEPEELKELTSFFQGISENTLIIAADQEGGRVSRLSHRKGYGVYPSHKEASGYSPSEAEKIYQKMAAELRETGINLNLAPVVDIDFHPPSPIIGGLERSFSDDPEKVIDYANIFIRAHKDKNVLTALKHFPGHGRASVDTHKRMADLTEVWDYEEIRPFLELTQKNEMSMIMTAHTFNSNLDADHPATLSEETLRSLLRESGYDGVIISDDLHMGAIQEKYLFEEAVILAVNAGIDILLFSNNPLAWPGSEDFKPEPYIGEKAVEMILKAVGKGYIDAANIRESYERIKRVKERLNQGDL